MQAVTFAIKDGRVFYRNRFVRTEALMREQEAQKVLGLPTLPCPWQWTC